MRLGRSLALPTPADGLVPDIFALSLGEFLAYTWTVHPSNQGVAMETFDVVFEAGGAKGIAFVGALEVLMRSGHTIRRLIGCSAGAITATFVAAGYTPNEMLETTQEKRNGKSAL